MKKIILLVVTIIACSVINSPAPSGGGYGSSPTTTVTTNTVGGTNQVVSILNGGGTGTYGALSNYSGKFPGQLVVSTANSSLAQIVPMRSTATGDFKYGSIFPGGISAIGDPQLMDSNVQACTVYINGNPTVQTTNQTGDYTLNSANMAVYSSGSGFNCVIVTNDANGVPHVHSLNSCQFVWVPTNAAPGVNKTNTFGGWLGIILNENDSFNKGLIIGGPGTIAADNTNRNRYGFAYYMVDKTVHIPIQMPGVSVPNDPGNVDLALFDTVNTNMVFKGGVVMWANQVAPNAGGLGIYLASSNGVNNVLTSTVDGTTVNAGSANNAAGIASFFRLRITADGTAGNGSIFNPTGDGLWVSTAGGHVSGLTVQGIGEVFCTTSGITISNNATVSTNLTVNGGVTLNGTVTQSSNSIPVAVTVGSSPFLFTNKTSGNLRCRIADGTAITTTIAENGVTTFPATTDINTELVLYVGEYITLTYSGGTPNVFTNR